MKPAERMALSRQHARELDPAERIKNFKEVTAGYDEETALLEARRCLQCKKPACVQGCPIRNDIPGFIALLREKKFEDAYWKVRETSTMPSVCSRICPQPLLRAPPPTVITHMPASISFFTAGPESVTLPLFIFAAVRRGVTPQIHALSTLVVLITVVMIISMERFTRR